MKFAGDFLCSFAVCVMLAAPVSAASFCGANVKYIEKLTPEEMRKEDVESAQINSTTGRGAFAYNRTAALYELEDWVIEFQTVDDVAKIYVEGHPGVPNSQLVSDAKVGTPYPLFRLMGERYEEQLLLNNFNAARAMKKKIDCLYTRQNFRFSIVLKDFGQPGKLGLKVSHGDRVYTNSLFVDHGGGNKDYQFDFVIRRYWGVDHLESLSDSLVFNDPTP